LRAKYSSHRKNSRSVGSPSGAVHERAHHIKSCVNCLLASPSLVLSHCRPPKQTSVLFNSDMSAGIFGKNMRTPRILTTRVGSVCQKDVRLVAVSLVKEWQRNVVSSTAYAR